MGDTDWDPDPVELRDGETRDETSHGRRTLATLRDAAEADGLDEDTQASIEERIAELEAEVADDAE